MSKKSRPAGSSRQTGRKTQGAAFKLTTAKLVAGAAVLAVIAMGIFFLTQGQASAQPLPAEVSVADAAARRNSGAFMLDVREPSEWAEFHVPGAVLIPLGQLPTRLSEVPKDKDIVVICRTGHRSAQGRDILLQAGYPRVTSVTGGITVWRDQGLQTVSGE